MLLRDSKKIGVKYNLDELRFYAQRMSYLNMIKLKSIQK